MKQEHNTTRKKILAGVEKKRSKFGNTGSTELARSHDIYA